MTDPHPTPQLTALSAPAEGLPDLVCTAAGLQRAAAALAQGTGPVAVDAERASGYRYGQAAYLVQLRRAGSGTWLIDPVPCPDLHVLSEALSGVEWVLHAASQDLPCLAELGLYPSAVFDTELAARLAGLPRVGLGAVLEGLLGVSLAKEHSAVDWSTRPLPLSWLNYAALDVELLVELRQELHELLDRSGKLPWAAQEFEAVRLAPTPTPRVDPWRRLSGLHRLRNRRHLGLAAELWQAREDLARERDIAPGRVLPDAAILAAVTANPTTLPELIVLAGFTGPAGRRNGPLWLAALARGRQLPETELPKLSLPSDAPPPARSWADRDPDAGARLRYARTAVAELSERLEIPAENLLTPDTLRRVLWQTPATVAELPERLTQLRARPWQIELLQPIIEQALSCTAANYPVAEPETSPPAPKD